MITKADDIDLPEWDRLMRRFYLDGARGSDGGGLVLLLMIGWLIVITGAIAGLIFGQRLFFTIVLTGLAMIFAARSLESKSKTTFDRDFVNFAKSNGFDPLAARGYLSVVDWDAIQISPELRAELDKNSHA